MPTKEPVKGMRDILPDEMRLRNDVLAVMRNVYGSFGFEQIETPCMERIENLQTNQGGDNEKLVFKVLKRGEKLAKAVQTSCVDELSDAGMRYDLTVPLARYYARNAEKLPLPFKAMQIGPVWRADNPQQGRYRQFCQADIDILGDESPNAEIELVCATSLFLKQMGIAHQVRINDRRLLSALAATCGFEAGRHSDVFVVMDKLDKIGVGGVCGELRSIGCTEESVSAYRRILEDFGEAPDKLAYCENALSAHVEAATLESLRAIESGVAAITGGACAPCLDLSLVRGMGYYTGTIFEVESPEFGSSIAGGGRYDRMVGDFAGKPVPACGFSVGFERIIQVLLEKAQVEESDDKMAVLYERGQTIEQITRLQEEYQPLREAGKTVLVQKKARNFARQKERLAAAGYGQVIVAHGDPAKGLL